MKANKVKRLLRKAAKKNEFTIDEITGTGSGEVDVFGSDAYGNDILITASRNQKGKIEELSYMNFGSSSKSFDDLYVSIEVDNAKKFLNGLGNTLAGSFITQQNMENTISLIDDIQGTSSGPYSSYISFAGEYAFA